VKGEKRAKGKKESIAKRESRWEQLAKGKRGKKETIAEKEKFRKVGVKHSK